MLQIHITANHEKIKSSDYNGKTRYANKMIGSENEEDIETSKDRIVPPIFSVVPQIFRQNLHLFNLLIDIHSHI